MKRVLPAVVSAVLLLLPALALAQPPAAPAGDALSKVIKASFDGIARYLVASAEKMPEADYASKPTPEVRSFGELVGHVANSQFSICARIKGEKNPNDGNDFEKKTAKADLVKGLGDSVAYCAAVYGEMTDAKAMEPLTPPASAAPPAQGAKPAPAPAPRVRALLSNLTHDWEHYGNMVTYLRLKKLVPPSSEPRK